TAGLTQSPLNFISGCAKLFDRSAHPTGKLRQLLGAEQQQDNEEDYHHVRSHKIQNTTDHWIHKSFISASQMCFTHPYRLRRGIFPKMIFIWIVQPSRLNSPAIRHAARENQSVVHSAAA